MLLLWYILIACYTIERCQRNQLRAILKYSQFFLQDGDGQPNNKQDEWLSVS